MTIYNLGSINIDKVLRVPHLPAPGETLAAHGYAEGLGGKGANQSVAAARAGAQVVHLGAVGPDGDAMLALMAADGIDLSQVARLETPTGMALIMVDDAAENSIAILHGANVLVPDETVAAALAAAAPGDTLLLQNETSGQAEAAGQARRAGLRVVYSAAPFEPEAVRQVLGNVSVLLLNELEAAQLTEALGQPLEALGVAHVVVTRGKAGAVHHDVGAGTQTAYPSPEVAAVDTTGAGDTFAGYLAAGLDQGLGWEAALRRALAAAALSVTRPGASAAIPDAADVAAFAGRSAG
ncbi:ribokinase [Poseidonocella sp. HB161398]|uniref:ribokinase n=1 Tax=Poseidonocella sp. HB161398 TaxID=2320855 RepID=UPI001108360D|nr:ribokinase [Poseidonocella sp. HB161398]